MEPDESQLRVVRDGRILHTLPNGIQIQRRMKHEPIRLEGLSKREIRRRTDKKHGSKFLPETTLRRIVEITREILEENEAVVGTNQCYDKVYEEAVGISNGRRVRGVRVRRSNQGRLAHAYPEDEKRL